MDPALAQLLATFLVAGGGGTLLASAARAIWKQATGRAGRERIRNTDLLTRAETAEQRAEQEAINRRKMQEYASQLRRRLIEKGIEPDEWPIDAQTTPRPRGRKKRAGPGTDASGDASSSPE
jgi:hypothetical protein